MGDCMQRHGLILAIHFFVTIFQFDFPSLSLVFYFNYKHFFWGGGGGLINVEIVCRWE